LSDQDLKCSCEVCSIPDSILSLSAKLKACTVQRNDIALDKLFAQIPLSDVKIIKDDYKWISAKIAAVCRFAHGVENETENMMMECSKIATSILPFAADIGVISVDSFFIKI
jgi:Na+/H+ antiporter NhaA